MQGWAALAVALTTATTAVALDRETIEQEVNAKQDELVSCYDAAVERNPELKKGKLVMRYHVSKSGKVTKARVVRNDLKDTQLGACVKDVFLTLDYGEQDKPTNVTYPLDFN